MRRGTARQALWVDCQSGLSLAAEASVSEAGAVEWCGED